MDLGYPDSAEPLWICQCGWGSISWLYFRSRWVLMCPWMRLSSLDGGILGTLLHLHRGSVGSLFWPRCLECSVWLDSQLWEASGCWKSSKRIWRRRGSPKQTSLDAKYVNAILPFFLIYFIFWRMYVELKASMQCEKLKMIVVRTRMQEDRTDGKPANSLLVSLVALQYSVMSPVLGRPGHNAVCSPLFLLPREASSTEINVQKQPN